VRSSATGCAVSPAKDNEPPITYFQMGAEEWRTAGTWPLKAVEPRSYYLQEGHGLATSAPAAKAALASFRYDPANPVPTVGGHVLDPLLPAGPQDQRKKVESRPDVLAFSTPALAGRFGCRRASPGEAVRLFGQTRYRFHGDPDRRLSRRAVDAGDRGNPADALPQRRDKGRVHEAGRDLFRDHPADEYGHHVRKGHKVRVLISSSNYSEVCTEPQ